MAEKKCGACGSWNPPHAIYCAQCGKPMTPVMELPEPLPADPGAPRIPWDKKSPGPPMLWLAVVGASALACFIFAALAVWLIMGGDLGDRAWIEMSRLTSGGRPIDERTATNTPKPTATRTVVPPSTPTSTPTAARPPAASASGTAVRTPTMTPDPSWTPPPLTLAKGIATVQPSADTIYSGVVLYNYLDQFEYEMMGRSDNCPHYTSGKGVLYRYRDGVPKWEEERYFMGWVTDPNKQYRIRADDAGLKAKQWKTYPGCP